MQAKPPPLNPQQQLSAHIIITIIFLPFPFPFPFPFLPFTPKPHHHNSAIPCKSYPLYALGVQSGESARHDLPALVQ